MSEIPVEEVTPAEPVEEFVVKEEPIIQVKEESTTKNIPKRRPLHEPRRPLPRHPKRNL